LKKFINLIIILLIVFISSLVIFKTIYKTEYLDIVKKECKKYNCSPYQILAIIKSESNFDENAHSKKGAIGLMQITLETANWCLENLDEDKITEKQLYNPETNIKIGTYYFCYLLERYGNIDTAISAYNGGMGNVDKWLNNPKYSADGKVITSTPYDETTNYIKKINNNITIYKLLYKEL